MGSEPRLITAAEAKEATLRLIAGAFRRDGERLASEKRPHFSIPCKPNEDDDMVVLEFIKQTTTSPADVLAALEPFASMAKNYEGFADERVVEVPVTIGELRRARDARGE